MSDKSFFLFDTDLHWIYTDFVCLKHIFLAIFEKVINKSVPRYALNIDRKPVAVHRMAQLIVILVTYYVVRPTKPAAQPINVKRI